MKYFVVDAFTDKVFQGNQAGVCIIDKPIDDEIMQNIAAENNLSETAFIIENPEDFDLRWFTPKIEVDLCGHATLASAFIVSNFIKKDIKTIRFNTMSGVLTVTKKDDFYEMDFPSRKPKKTQITTLMEEAIGCPIIEAHESRDLLLLVKDENTVLTLYPNFELLKNIPDCLGVIVTSKGDNVDFVSRFFAPKVGVPEDPVTGSAHSTLIPFWSEILNKSNMLAMQISKRGGTLHCEDCGERVKISGKAALYLSGEINY